MGDKTFRCRLSSEVSVTTPEQFEFVLDLLAKGFKIQFPPYHSANGHTKPARRRRRRAPNIPAQQVKAMADLRSQGITWRAIAKKFGVTESGACNAVHRYTAARKTK